jgi:L-threonylcarbamoyladenylate synthase
VAEAICENHEQMVTAADIQKAAEIMRSGGLVVFPTETVYGLGANAFDASAVRKVYELKGRPSNSPLIVHVASVEQARELAAEWPEEAEQLARAYWPGPLTLVVQKKSVIPDEVTAGLPTVGLRVPRHRVALDLLRALGLPIAAPSANRFTQLSATTAAHVRDAFGAQTPFLLDGGDCEVGIESTVIAVSKEGLEVLRPGMAIVGNVIRPKTEVTDKELPHRAPGQHRKHYSPKTRVLLVTAGRLPQEGRGAYVGPVPHASGSLIIRPMPADPAEYAKNLYKVLHELDSKNLDWIAIEIPPETAEWAAIRDRLIRSAY